MFAINQFLQPIEYFFLKKRNIIGYIILSFSLLAIYFAKSYNLSLEGAEIAFNILWVILWIPIFARVFGIKIFQAMLPFRKELGIVMGIFSLVHFAYMFNMLPYYFSKNLPLAILGILPQIIIFLLTLTSNDFSKKFLGKNWKRLHKLVYIVPLLISLQIALGTAQIRLSPEFTFTNKFEILPWIVLGAYYIFKILEWKNIKFFTEEKKAYPKWQKFYCVPCGYVYDPKIGNIEDGIAPGTEFADVPDDWRCPDCGVTKADFIPYNEDEMMLSEPVKILKKIYLNPTTIELILELNDDKKAKIGQFATFEYEDENGKFRRQYSVSAQNWRQIHFLIKLQKDGRGAKILQKIQEGENMNFVGFFWDFILQENDNTKIFIATGTGLAPIYYMMKSCPNVVKKLHMSVATEAEIFYEKELEKIPNLEINYYVTREDIDGFKSWRMQFTDIDINPSYEFYLCGNPAMVENIVKNLQDAGCDKVYFEKF